MAKKMIPSRMCCLSVIIFYLVTSLFCLSPPAALARTDTIRLNCPDSYWYPFVFLEQEQSRGIFIDIVEQALENLSLAAGIMAVPYKRALKNCQKGKVDGVIGIGFSTELTTGLEFPPDAATGTASEWQIARVDHVVVSSASDEYRFSGDTISLPLPIRLRQGSLLLHAFQEAGVTIHELRNDIQGIRQLSRDGAGVVITTSVYAEKIVNDDKFMGQFRIHGTPLASNSYYLAFAKNGRLTRQQKSSIWAEISRLRSDYIFIMQVYSRY